IRRSWIGRTESRNCTTDASPTGGTFERDLVQLGQVAGRRGDLVATSLRRPAEGVAGQLGQLVEQGSRDGAHEGHTGSPVDQVAEMLDLLVADQEAHLVGGVALEMRQ